MTATVSVDVYARDRNASGTFNKVGNAAHRSGGLVGKFGTTVAGVFTGTALYNGAARLTHALVGMTEAAAQDEIGVRRMALQFRNSADATDGQIAATEDWIDAQGRALGIADDELRPALSSLVAVTHNVKDAQEDVSIALDTAAGRGKSFSSVIEAMIKGENGATAGFGRMGVATKDASGKALSFDQISKNLAKTFKGQAAEAADTAAGKYEKLKVQFDETGEAIGYKLIPLATAAGGVLLDDVLPAAQDLGGYLSDELGPTVRDMADWFSDNKDELKDFAQVVGEDVVGGLKVLVDVGGDVVGFLDGLPGPVKELGIEAGIAMVVLPPLARALTGVGTGAAGAATGLRSVVTGLQTADRRSALLSRGLLNVAGIGGMIAIEEGSRRGNKAVSLFGDAMTGAFVGGTLGSAIPGVGTAIGAVGGAAVGTAVGLFRMHKGADAAGDSAENAKPDFDSLADSIANIDEASRKAVKSQILLQLTEDGVVSSAGQLGIATSDLIKASLGNDKAIGRVNTAWEKQGDLLQGLQNQKISDWIYGLRAATMQSEAATRRNNAALDGTDRSAGNASRALGTVGRVRPQTDKWSALYTGDLNKSVRNTSTSTSAMRQLLSGEPGKARANMGPFGTDLAHQLAGVKGNAHTAGIGIGNSIESGVSSGLSGIISNTIATIQAAVTAAQQAAGGGGGKGGGKGAGKGGSKRQLSGPMSKSELFGELLKGSGSHTTGNQVAHLDHEAAILLASLVDGIRKGKKPLDRVLDAITEDFQNKVQAWKDLLSERDQFAAGLATSVFSLQGDDDAPLTIEQILAHAAGQATQAAQLDQDIQHLLSMGISQDLIDQMQAEGAQGIEAIHVLAGANQAQINQLIASNASSQTSYAHAAQQLYSGEVAQAAAAKEQAEAIKEQVQAMNKLADKLEHVEFVLHGNDLVAILVKDKKNKGTK